MKCEKQKYSCGEIGRASPCLVDYGKNVLINETPHPPSNRTYNGVKVTMIDEARKIFVIDLLNESTCSLIRNINEEYIEHLEKSKSKSI